MMRLLRLRRLVQVAALALLAATPWLNRGGFTGMKGSLFAFDFCVWPFADPLGPVQMRLSGMAPGWRLAAGGGAALLLALCLGRVFCSWLCPFGLLSEAAQGLRSKAAPPKPAKHSFRSRAAVMLAGLTLAALLGFPLLNQLSLPGGFSLGLITAAAPLSDKAILSLETRILFFALPFLPVLLVLAAEIVTGKRLWCRWVCLQSVLLSLMARLPLAPRLQRSLSRCTCKNGAHACRAACPLGLDPRNPRSASPRECTNCGACVLACSHVHAGSPAALSLSRRAPQATAYERKSDADAA